MRFLSIDPGEMDTEMHAAAMPDADRSALPSAAATAHELAQLIAKADELENGSRLQVSP